MSSNGHYHFVPSGEQRQAIEHVHGPMLVVAGAGTGKTTVLARRIAHLIQSEAAKPDEILAVTYTRNSAAELIQRVAAILYPEENQQSLYPEMDRPQAACKLLRSGLQAHTFHSYCYRLLNEAGNKFQLVDDKDLFVLLRRRIADFKLRHYIKAADPGKFLKELLDFFGSCHDELRTPDDYDAYLKQLERGEIPLPRMAKSKDAGAMSDDEILGRCREVAYGFRYVENLLQQEGLGSFGHIMSRAVDLLSRRQSVLQRQQRRARFILIDEFQDSNVAQIKLASLLAGEEANVFAVGDPDQAIYQFRGATSGAFDQFLKIFGPDRVKRVTMSANRRSTPSILRCAHQAIKCNPEILSGDAIERGWPRQALTWARFETDATVATAPAVQAVVYNSYEQEAAFIAVAIQAMQRQRPETKLSRIAVLYRNHHQREKIVAELHHRGIPVQVKGVDLFDTPELRDAMAVLRILDSSHPVALFRVAALPQFSVDPQRFRAELALAGRDGLAEVALGRDPGGAHVIDAIRRARQDLVAAGNLATEALNVAQRDFGLAESMPLRRLIEFAERWRGKPRQIVEQGTLHEFLEYVNLFREAGGALLEETDEDDPVAALAPNELGNAPLDDAVQLMTVHAAKGLEFRCVFVVRVASQSFPGNYKEPLVEFPRQLRCPDTAVDNADAKTQHEREERRLFYVAMTRAMDELYLCGKAARGKNLIPTKYIRELISEGKLALKDAIASRVLEPEPIPSIHAAAELVPTVSQWTQLPPREDGHLHALSASAIQQYENCPLAYKLKYDWRLPEEASAALQFGSAMHLALKAYFDGVRVGRPPDEETVIACFLDELSKSKIDEPLQRALYEKDGRNQLTALLRSELGRPRGEIFETERRFKVEIGGAQVSGRFDRLDRVAGGQVEIVDYKTGKPKTLEDADDSLQLSIYALAARSLGYTPSALVFINLQNGVAVESRRSTQQLLEAEKRVAEVAAKISAGEFEPGPGPGCRRCSYHGICPAQESPLPTALAQRAAKIH